MAQEMTDSESALVGPAFFPKEEVFNLLEDALSDKKISWARFCETLRFDPALIRRWVRLREIPDSKDCTKVLCWIEQGCRVGKGALKVSLTSPGKEALEAAGVPNRSLGDLSKIFEVERRQIVSWLKAEGFPQPDPSIKDTIFEPLGEAPKANLISYIVRKPIPQAIVTYAQKNEHRFVQLEQSGEIIKADTPSGWELTYLGWKNYLERELYAAILDAKAPDYELGSATKDGVILKDCLNRTQLKALADLSLAEPAKKKFKYKLSKLGKQLQLAHYKHLKRLELGFEDKGVWPITPL